MGIGDFRVWVLGLYSSTPTQCLWWIRGRGRGRAIKQSLWRIGVRVRVRVRFRVRALKQSLWRIGVRVRFRVRVRVRVRVRAPS